jgi:hypothetical protein
MPLMVLGALPVLLLVRGAVTLSAALLWPAMSAFMHSNILSIASLLADAINFLSCALCCSWRRVNIIVVVLPFSLAAANSCTARAASLKRERFLVACKHCLCSSHFSMSNVGGSAKFAAQQSYSSMQPFGSW